MVATVAPAPAPLPIDPEYRPASAIQHVSASASVEELMQVLNRDGGLIIDDFVSPKDMDKIKSEIAAAEGDIVRDNSAIGIVPKETKLTPGLVGKSDTIASVCEAPLLTSLRNELLADEWIINREGIEEVRALDPLLSLSIGFNIGHGAPRQYLHRDDNIHNTKHAAFDLKKISQFACLIAGVDTTRDNGATMFVPGSHRWDDSRQPRIDEICFAEMKAGSALIFLGGAYHGGGHNSTHTLRTVYGLFFIRGNLRQEENQFLAIPRSKVLSMSKEMQALLGYKQPKSVLGIVDNKDPMSDLESVLELASS